MSSLNNTGKWFLVPTLVLLIGILSVVMLLEVNRIDQRQLANSALVEAIQKIQINSVAFHLFQEEHVGGDRTADIKIGLAGIDEALGLIDFILDRVADGQTAYLKTAEDREVHNRSQEIKSLLKLYRKYGLESLLNPASSGIGTDADRRFHAVYLVILEKSAFMESILKSHSARNLAASRKLFLAVLGIWTIIVISASGALWNIERRRNHAEEALLHANNLLVSQADELQRHRENLEDLVVKRTAEVTTANAKLLLEIDERMHIEASLKESDSQIRQLSTQLLRAQEIERRRISLELHDELGQALSVTKLRLRAIERSLRNDQQLLRDECEQLLEYMNETIENVRRLSLAISPTVLEDLGLTSAIHWLIANVAKIPNLNVTTSIDEIDCCIHQSQWITIYRVVQEALTNIGKHAHAGNVSVMIRKNSDSIDCSIEDDGLGFDPEHDSIKTVSEKGLGLATMDERVRMMGGNFELRSSRGKGTRVTFSIPAGTGEAHDG